MPMRIVVSSGFGSSPFACDPPADGELPAGGVPPQAASAKIAATAAAKTRIVSRVDLIAPPPLCPRTARFAREKCNTNRARASRIARLPPSLIEVRGQPIAYELRGAGAPVVLVAGTGYPGATWPAEFIEPLLARHAVLTFDHRGTG